MRFQLKLFFVFCLTFVGVYLLQIAAFSYEYRLIDSQSNISYSSQMITIEAPKKHFYLGLYAPYSDSPIYCIIDTKSIKTNKKNLVGGNCYAMFRDSNSKYLWQENKAGNFNTEKKDIIKERQKEGLKYSPAGF